jgi:hypothetical protein
MSMTRKQFLGSLAGVAAFAACGGDDGGGTDGAITRNCATNGTTVQIGNNHGHALVVTASEINAGVDKTYDIMGTSDHPHSVTVTAANFATLQSNANGSVMVTSTSGGGHTHSVLIFCA